MGDLEGLGNEKRAGKHRMRCARQAHPLELGQFRVPGVTGPDKHCYRPFFCPEDTQLTLANRFSDTRYPALVFVVVLVLIPFILCLVC